MPGAPDTAFPDAGAASGGADLAPSLMFEYMKYYLPEVKYQEETGHYQQPTEIPPLRSGRDLPGRSHEAVWGEDGKNCGTAVVNMIGSSAAI